MFNVGDMIAHPMHGAGVIDSIEERRVNGVTRSYYLMKMRGGMTVMVPVENCDAVGVRPICCADEAENIMCAIGGIDADMTSNWNRRYRENMQRIKSGDLIEVARVVKGLMARESEKGLSTGERKMLHSAKQIFISEIVLSQKLSYEEVETRINAAFIEA
ncbi:MAG: CarD family transcriptional regulator [Oscillospiraceae bacterium]|jgi:CarD family transcriptional regulator|nr:CarD family transcriptional regulator [Oscillospiraceae bacterium]